MARDAGTVLVRVPEETLDIGQVFQITASSPTPVAGPALPAGARNSFRLEMPASSVTTVVLTP